MRSAFQSSLPNHVHSLCPYRHKFIVRRPVKAMDNTVVGGGVYTIYKQQPGGTEGHEQCRTVEPPRISVELLVNLVEVTYTSLSI